MVKNPDQDQREAVRAWMKQRLHAAVFELIDGGIFDNPLVEAKPAWAAPFQILIGKIREHDEPRKFRWVICGEVPTDHLDSAAAATPREAARHFAMKWQLDAARRQDLPALESPRALADSELANQAEALYALVQDTKLWQQQSEL